MICHLALTVLLALLSQGIDAHPAGSRAIVVTMNVSAYDDSTGDGLGITASGETTQHGSLAAGPNIPFGTNVLVPDYGVGHVVDRGSSITDRHLDLWMESEDAAWTWGRRNITVLMFW